MPSPAATAAKKEPVFILNCDLVAGSAKKTIDKSSIPLICITPRDGKDKGTRYCYPLGDVAAARKFARDLIAVCDYIDQRQKRKKREAISE